MNDSSVFFSVTSRTFDLARSALPQAPVVETRPSTRSEIWFSTRRSTSRMFQWLANLAEPATDCGCATPANTAHA